MSLSKRDFLQVLSCAAVAGLRAVASMTPRATYGIAIAELRTAKENA